MPTLIALVGGFASGIFFRSLVFHGWAPAAFSLFIALIFGIAWFLADRSRYLFASLFFALAALGMFRAAAAETPLPDTFLRDLTQRVSYEAVIIADPDLRDSSERITLEVSAHGETVRMLAVVPRTTRASVGDRVRVSGTLALPQPFADDNGRLFRYDKYLEKDGIRFLLNFATMRVESSAPWYDLGAWLARGKHVFLDGIAAALPEPHASLAGGIVIGGKSGLGPELQRAFITSGLVQIIVLSGYNVMVVAEWVMALLAYAKLSRRSRAIAGASALLLFVGMAGATATSIRAALMALIALYARATGKTYAAGRALLVVILFMLVWNPLYLAFDPGFGLSVAATAGLIWLAPIIETRLTRITNAFWKNAIATTLAAQVAVLPLLLYDTGNLSLVALPANLLAMPLVPLAMGLSALAGVAGALFAPALPMLALIFGFPAYVASAALIALAKGSAVLPGGALTVPAFPFVAVAVAYAVLAIMVIKRKPAVALAAAGKTA